MDKEKSVQKTEITTSSNESEKSSEEAPQGEFMIIL